MMHSTPDDAASTHSASPPTSSQDRAATAPTVTVPATATASSSSRLLQQESSNGIQQPQFAEDTLTAPPHRHSGSSTTLESQTRGSSSRPSGADASGPPSTLTVPNHNNLASESPSADKHITLAVGLDTAALMADEDEEEEDEHPDGAAPVYTHTCHKLLPGPPCVRNILGNELCERFSWYGLRAILVLYFHENLGWSKPSSISVFSYIGALAYFMPLLGGYVSDAKLGKYRTIIVFSIVYVLGGALLSLAASQRLVWLSILGLVGIGIGTGGIKPCVSSFGADQFTQRRVRNAKELAEREHAVSSFFHFFYFAINLGSVGSFIFTPLLRKYFGYAVAFGVPAILLTVATFIFWLARKEYFRGAPAGSVLSSLAHTFGVAWRNRGSQAASVPSPSAAASSRAPHNWIDNARSDPSVTPQHVENAKSLWRVLPIFAVLPVFWMLFNQQSSTWTLQAEEMKLHGLQPEQIGVMNPVLIMLLLPLFDRVIYPAVARCGIDFTPLRRMGVGMLVSVLAFLLSAGVEYKVSSATSSGAPHSISVFWQLPQIALISIAEILISVTGLEFAYTQAATQLKSCVAALFLITSAIGDLLTGVLYGALAHALTTTTMLVFFAGLMVLNFLLFLCVAARYQPVLVLDDKVRAADEEKEGTEEERQQQQRDAEKKQWQRNSRDGGAEPDGDEARVNLHGARPVPLADLELVSLDEKHPTRDEGHAPFHVKRASTTSRIRADELERDGEYAQPQRHADGPDELDM
jgi:POT family proton-dependent oligopeptide transporter